VGETRKGVKGWEKVEEGEKIMEKGEEGELRQGEGGKEKSTPVLPLYHVESQGPHYKYYMYAP